MHDKLENEYFNWIFNLLCGLRHIDAKKYTKLFEHLFSREFVYILPMDENRAKDGINLRYRFGYYYDYAPYEIDQFLDKGESSILEMMVALSIRCEESIMNDPDYGDRTSQWFWIMIENLGLLQMTNDNYDQETVDYILDNFLNRNYEPNGAGGLFTVTNPMRDMRKTEIWYQLCWFINENEM